MDNSHLKFHHLGLVTGKSENAIRFVKHLGYTVGDSIQDPLQNVNLIMCSHPSQPDIEIIYPTDTSGPLDNLIQSNKEMIYHIGYEVDNVELALAEFKKENLRNICVVPPKPAVLFNGRKVSFYKVTGIGLIEFIENDD